MKYFDSSASKGEGGLCRTRDFLDGDGDSLDCVEHLREVAGAEKEESELVEDGAHALAGDTR